MREVVQELCIFLTLSYLQIRFDSFTAPLLLLGCFSKGVEKFPSSPVLLTGRTLDSSEYFVSEFKTWQLPSGEIDPNFFVFAAAEILRFLRDIALEVSTTQSKSLLHIYQKDKCIIYGSLPATTALYHGTPSLQLVHAGAILCMLDLLPAISVDVLLLSRNMARSYAKLESSTVIGGSQDFTDKACEQEEISITGEVLSDGRRDSLQVGIVGLDDAEQHWTLEQDSMTVVECGDKAPRARNSIVGEDNIKRGSVEVIEGENIEVISLLSLKLTEDVRGTSSSVSVEETEGEESVRWAREKKGDSKEESEKSKEDALWETETCKMSAKKTHKVCAMYVHNWGEPE